MPKLYICYVHVYHETCKSYIAQLHYKTVVTISSTSNRGLPKFYGPARPGPARCILIGAVASAAGTGHVVNLSFWLNRDAPCGVVDNRALLFSLWLQLESVRWFICYILPILGRPLTSNNN